MAIYHLSVKPISRSSGRTSTGAAAYRSAKKIVNERTGEIFDYTRKRGVEHSEIVLPVGSTWEPSRSELWNAAELAEKRKDACVAREHEVALPKELCEEDRLELARTYARDLADRHGCAVDLAIHAPHKGPKGESNENYHAHLLCTTRQVDGAGLGQKCQREKAGQDRKADLATERSTWADVQNTALELAGQREQVDHRSLKDQGIDREPTSHKGVAVVGMERRGIETDVGQRLASAQAEGERQRAEAAALNTQVIDLSTSLTTAIAEREAHHQEQRHARDNHPTRTHEPAALAEMRDVWGVDNVHDLNRTPDLLQSHAPDHLRPHKAEASHPDVLKLDAAERRVEPASTPDQQKINKAPARAMPNQTPYDRVQAWKKEQREAAKAEPAQPAPEKTGKGQDRTPEGQKQTPAAPAKALDEWEESRRHLSDEDRGLIARTEKNIAGLVSGNLAHQESHVVEVIGNQFHKLELAAQDAREMATPSTYFLFAEKHRERTGSPPLSGVELEKEKAEKAADLAKKEPHRLRHAAIEKEVNRLWATVEKRMPHKRKELENSLQLSKERSYGIGR